MEKKRNLPWNLRVHKEYYDALLQQFRLNKLLDSMGMSDFKKQIRLLFICNIFSEDYGYRKGS